VTPNARIDGDRTQGIRDRNYPMWPYEAGPRYDTPYTGADHPASFDLDTAIDTLSRLAKSPPDGTWNVKLVAETVGVPQAEIHRLVANIGLMAADINPAITETAPTPYDVLGVIKIRAAVETYFANRQLMIHAHGSDPTFPASCC
jgi:hypothetical protein